MTMLQNNIIHSLTLAYNFFYPMKHSSSKKWDIQEPKKNLKKEQELQKGPQRRKLLRPIFNLLQKNSKFSMKFQKVPRRSQSNLNVN